MAAADGFAMSSLSEGLPMVLLEAMAAGVPCVATSVGGIPELFANGAGMLAAPDDPESLKAAMLAMSADPERRSQIAASAFSKVAQDNDLERVVDHYLELFGLPPRWPEGDNSARWAAREAT
jgi:glycosyltransferase involved in cell wall biosynthesis